LKRRGPYQDFRDESEMQRREEITHHTLITSHPHLVLQICPKRAKSAGGEGQWEKERGRTNLTWASSGSSWTDDAVLSMGTTDGPTNLGPYSVHELDDMKEPRTGRLVNNTRRRRLGTREWR